MTRRRTSEVELSMFPFLSVLCVVIGILMLFMIAIIGTRILKAEAVERVAAGRLPGPDGSGGGESAGPSVPDDQHQGLSAEIERLAGRLAAQKNECRELRGLQTQLEDLIEMKRDELDGLAAVAPGGFRSGRALGLPEKVKVVPDTTREVRKKPILVEVTAAGYVVHPEQAEYAVDQLARGDSPLRKFIQRVDAVREREYLLLLVHPNGVTSYKKLRGCLRDNYPEQVRVGVYQVTKTRIDVGVEPFSPDWRVMMERGIDP